MHDNVIEKTEEFTIDLSYIHGEITKDLVKRSWGTVVKLVYSLVLKSFKNSPSTTPRISAAQPVWLSG